MSYTLENVFSGQGYSIPYLTTTDSLATITAAAYLDTDDYEFKAEDFVFAKYGTTGTPGFFNISADSSNVLTLVPRANLISRDITVPVASLASAGSVVIQASNGSEQYKVRHLMLNSGGTNFSGGGGDRLGQVTDGTTIYTVIPAAVMQSLVNAQWGVSTPLPNAASAANNTSTAAGADLVFKYSGGSADYSAGSLVITALIERVA